MGWNTTVVIMNDALSNIEADPEFGRKLAAAVLAAVDGKKHDVSAGGFCNAATVIETHHSSGYAVVMVGMNDGEVVDHLLEDYRRKNWENRKKLAMALEEFLDANQELMRRLAK